METAITQLKQDFYTHLRTMQTSAAGSCQSTLSILTDEELKELEHAWVALAVWKRNQTH